MSDFNPKAVKKFGGGKIYALEIADGVNGGVAQDSTDNTWINFGFIESSNLTDSTETEDVKDETGGVIDNDEVERVVKLSGLAMQSDKATLDFFRKGVRNKYFMVYRDAGMVNGKKQEQILGICVIKPQMENESGKKRTPFEITVIKNSANIEFGGLNVALPSVASVVSGTILAEDHFSIEETVV